MSKFTAIIGLVAGIAVFNLAFAKNLSITSSEQRTTLIELYTSEGCSSCPPADHWLSSFKNDPHLWRQIVPVAFHVDYWNYLGWRDRFAEKRFSIRQRDYEAHEYLQTVYTPGVMKNGREWRGWPSFGQLVSTNADKTGILKLNIRDNKAVAEFDPIYIHHPTLVLNVALLGFDQSTRITAGENAGKVLKHDFVVLDFQQYTQQINDGLFVWKLPDIFKSATKVVSGIAMWVTSTEDPTPLQATGGWLK